MFRLVTAALIFVVLATRSLFAQNETVWVQIEAHPTLSLAQERARDYETLVEDVNGFTVRGGWYAIALGPYLRDDAEQVLRVLRAEGRIPHDSFITYTETYSGTFWPVGGAGLNQQPAAAAEQQATTQPDPTPEPEPVPQPAIQLPDETPAEARRSEAALTRDERMDLQRLLQWAGYYNSGIDGAFGPGTRASMAAWQDANGYEPTGILTTGQRAALLAQYNAILNGLDLQTVTDDRAGIRLKLPLGAVQFDRYEAPFAHFLPTGSIPEARVLLISQEGDRNTLYGLYDIMQTLEIVPLDGPRKLDGDSFMLVGKDPRFISHTQAALKDGRIKGFTLIWPTGDEERRARLLEEMQQSFDRLASVLDHAAGSDLDQRVDLISGLEVRQPKLTRSGFYVDATGAVVTTADAVVGCIRVTLDSDTEATVLGTDAALGVAVLKPVQALAPSSIARFQTATPRLQSEISVAGFSYGGMLDAPTLTFGTLADLRGLNGEETLDRLALATLPGDAGGPVFDTGGEVLGMLLPRTDSARQLPQDVSFALDGAAIRAVLTGLGVTPAETSEIGSLPPEDLTGKATGMTVLVSCWE
ncbi:serine protease [Thalassovita sp.]|uniref:serine protease n=1 Tax=Thalassovita sp. TaxID=1979401 RepID=UPI0029DE5D2A|nr:trypsin-like peptidase domain-containing protein [Thalassovita sp.]